LHAISEKRILALEKKGSPMLTSSEGISGKRGQRGGKPSVIKRVLWPRLVEIWIFISIAMFFLIRVLGSQTGQRFVGAMSLRHHP
jgi:hypothetical protein